MKREKFDLIFGIGENCNTSLALRRNNLQIASFPFDWLSFSEFKRNLEFILNDFDGFLDENDLEYLPDSFNGRTDTYINKKNNLRFVHDFFPEKAIHSQFEGVKKKYQKRENRLINSIKSAKKVLVVYMTSKESELCEILKEINEISERMNSQYSETKFSYLYIQDNKIKNFEYKSENIRVVSLDNTLQKRKINLLGIKISTKFFPSSEVLKSYKLNMSIKEKLSGFVYSSRKILINLIPNKNFQLKLRHKSSYN